MELPKIKDVAKSERTLCILKPDTIYRGAVGKITSRFEQVGLKLISCRMVMSDREKVEAHYGWGDEWVENLGHKTLKTYKDFDVDVKEVLGTDEPMKLGQEIVDKLIEYLMSGPIILMVWEGVKAIEAARKIRGSTTPIGADVGSIIGDMSHDSQFSAPLKGRSLCNLVHLSGDPEEAEKEIEIWFGDKPKFEKYDRADGMFF